MQYLGLALAYINRLRPAARLLSKKVNAKQAMQNTNVGLQLETSVCFSAKKRYIILHVVSKIAQKR